MIDAHLHLFDQSRFSYLWMKSRKMPNASLPDTIGPSIVVEAGADASQSAAEVEWVRACASDIPAVLGMVAAIDFNAADVRDRIANHAADELVCGVRHNFEALKPGDLNIPAHRESAIAAISSDLTVDLCVRADQLRELSDFVSALADGGADTSRCVLDHLGKPDIAEWGADGSQDPGAVQRWRTDMRALASAGIAVKLSGIGGQFDEAPSAQMLETSLRTYGLVCAELFGAQRTMVGSDHPVSTVSKCVSLTDWGYALGAVLSGCVGEVEVKSILESTARKFYLGAAPDSQATS